MTATLDGLDANAPGVLPADDPVLGPKLTVENVDGNHIVLDIGGGAYAFYAHLHEGHAAGQGGRQGHARARSSPSSGNTGNANASHLHFHLMNGPSVLGSDGLPYVLDTFAYDGQISAAAAGRRRRLPHRRLLRPGPAADARAAHGPATPAWAIVNFPG